MHTISIINIKPLRVCSLPGLLGTAIYVYPSVLNRLNESRERTSNSINGKCGTSSEKIKITAINMDKKPAVTCFFQIKYNTCYLVTGFTYEAIIDYCYFE